MEVTDFASDAPPVVRTLPSASHAACAGCAAITQSGWRHFPSTPHMGDWRMRLR
jgi:hypothetical protein